MNNDLTKSPCYQIDVAVCDTDDNRRSITTVL